MALSQNVSRVGWISMIKPSSESDPVTNNKGQIWWFEGSALVLLFSDRTMSLSEISFFDWDFPRGLSPEDVDVLKSN